MALGVAIAMLWAAGAPAETAEEPKERFKTAEVTGTVVAYTGRSLSLEFNRTKTEIMEMLLPVDPAVTQFERAASLKDLKRGDRVRVAYRQTWRQSESGEWTLRAAVATKISRLGEGPSAPKLSSGPAGGGI
jgi:hypothetical protein